MPPFGKMDIPRFRLDGLFEGFEPIRTDRLILRPVREADAEAMFDILRHPDVAQFFGMPPVTELSMAKERCEGMARDFAERTSFRLGLELAETGEFLGTGGFWRFVTPHFRAEIGYELGREHWGKGYMTEALRPILQRGFDAGLNTVEANIHPDNANSRRVLERLGFREEGFTRDAFYDVYLGGFTDNTILGLTRRDWETR